MKIDVLDHGYVEFVEAWGHGKGGENVLDPKLGDEHDYEVGLIEAARQSTQGSFRGWGNDGVCDCNMEPGDINHSSSCALQHPAGDAKLLKFLYEHHHLTPFEFAGMTLEVQAPIFVFREWHRHRTQAYNEMSARYAPLPDLYYMPTVERVLLAQLGNKQAQGVKGSPFVTQETAEQFGKRHLKQVYELCEEVYQAALAAGIPKELARLVMPVGHYSRMRASASLRNWLQFLTLRLDPAAQWEIRLYAHAVAKVVAAKFPQTWKLFEAGRPS